MRRRYGFSLLEVSVSLVLMGVLAGVLLQFRHADTTDCNATTRSQLEQIKNAMHDYVIAHDRFPVPALRTAGIEDTQYGREAPIASLDAVGGVLFGALPFQELKLAPSYAGDCWGNKFTYAVTQDLTDSGKFKSTAPNPVYNGVITLKTSATTVFNNKIAYAVISHGADAVGAVKLNYSDSTNTQRRWCNGTEPIEKNNCSVTSSTIMAAEFNDGKDAGAGLFDDIVIHGGKEQRIVNGQCDNSYALGCVKGTVSNDNGLAACNTTRTWHCDGANGGTNDTSCSYTNPVCLNCTSTSLSWGGGCSGVFPNTAHATVSAPATANTNPAFTASSNASASCNNGVFSAPFGTCTPVPPPVNGVCNNSVPLGCFAGGSPIADNGATSCNTTRTWICPGYNGGSDSPTCSFNNAACLNCSPQTLGWGGGCSASFPGAAHGMSTVPITNSNPAFNGTGTASCNNGTFTASGSCTPVVPVNGSCDNSSSSPACAAGTVSNDNGDTTPGNTRTWHCDGSNGGTNDTSCSHMNPGVCPTFIQNCYGTGSERAAADSAYTASCMAAGGYVNYWPGPYSGCNFFPLWAACSCTPPVCTPVSVANGSVGPYPSCTITCDSGYTLQGNSCVAAGCAAGWSPIFNYDTEDTPQGMNAVVNSAGHCTGGTGSHSPSTKGRTDECVTSTWPNYTIFGRVCNGMTCLPNGTLTTDSTACCSGHFVGGICKP